MTAQSDAFRAALHFIPILDETIQLSKLYHFILFSASLEWFQNGCFFLCAHVAVITTVMISGDDYLPDTKTVPDELPGRGPLGGIYSCLRAAANDRCLVLSVDTPLVPRSALYHLCQAHKGGATVLCHGDFQEPLLGVYDRKTAGMQQEGKKAFYKATID